MSEKNQARVVIIICMLLTMGSIYSYFNIKQNTIYYAMHMPKSENSYPEYWMFVEHNEYVRYPLEMQPDILGKAGIFESKQCRLGITDKNYILFHKKNDYGLYYNKEGLPVEKFSFDNNLDKHTQKYFNTKEIEEASIIRDDCFKPILDYQKEPFINLQWLFNLIYEKEYNK